MCKIRTIPQAVREIKAADPLTALTISGLRQLVATGKFPCVEVASKRLVDVDKLQAFLSGDYAPAPPAPLQEQHIGVIRKIAVGR
ncbi:MAG: hypothetical protein BWY15_01858 [Firmicutes bacterium ADurb.Bin193]|nr:MAG: hypothetical protein BWY15_01858 [Firmicutes bacterium ADurb.Bin193]